MSVSDSRKSRVANSGTPDASTYMVLEALPLAACLVDMRGTVRWLNRQATHIIGRSRTRCLHQPLATLLGWHRPSPPAIVTSPTLRDILMLRQPAQGTHGILPDETGQVIQITWTCQPLAATRDAAALFTFRDLTEEHAIEDDRNRLAQIAEESPSALVELDADANLLYANPAMTTLLRTFGYSKAGFPNALPENIDSLVKQCLGTGRTSPQIEVALSGFNYAWTFCPVPSHHHVRGYGIDLTDVRTTQQQLQKATAHLECVNGELAAALQKARDADRAKTNFFATISHELRTPMNGVIGMAGLLRDSALSDDQRGCVDTIHQCGEALLSIINDILDCSKIESGKLELECIAFNLRTTVEDVLAQFAERAQTKGIEITGLVHSTVPTGLRGDPGRLRQVLTNLVANGVKFTDCGEVTLQVYLADDGPNSALVRFEITDTGIGIAPDSLDRLFTPFSQADSSMTRRYGGTGLGLAICKQLIELMGGQIGVNSTPGQGSTFWCTARLLKQQPESSSTTHADLVGRRVLVVDDNESHRMILHHFAQGWGMDDHGAEDAERAVQLVEEAAARHQPYDVAVLDMMMPGTDGLMLARLLKAHPAGRRIKLLLLTSLVQKGQSEQAKQAGIDVYITKPVRHDQLYGGLCRALGVLRPTEMKKTPPGRALTEPLAPPAAPVLVVEDNMVNQKLMARLMERLGYSVDVSASGHEAIEAWERSTYSAILMDCQMPVMDGFEATSVIRNKEREGRVNHYPGHIPIIAVTANAMQGDRERCLAAGMDDYLSKPIKSEELQNILQRWIPSHASACARIDAAVPTVGRTDETAHADTLRSSSRPTSFDAAALLENIGGDPDFVRQLLEMFLVSGPDMVCRITVAVQKGDTRSLEQSAHLLKGTAGNLCARPTALLASQLEALSRTDRMEDAKTLVEPLHSAITRLTQDIEGYLNGLDRKAA
ncbi:putative Hybrid histidine kinase [Nitrospira sp. KM1]|uniref:response regulator n=1 Tax=Nitrospira sp. KM1 TaxID=1936990 RepID=UPI0013A712C3|nr:response regulator [Nitrospira sp. KM1]BCA54784.1 putative Hybrid histidine kinase [Nitrospira sp. KM1]